MPHYEYQSESPDDPDRCCLVRIRIGRAEKSDRHRRVGGWDIGEELTVVEGNDALR